MARANRKTTPSLRDDLFLEPYSFEFHQAVKLLEMLEPSRIPFGEGVNPGGESVLVKSRVFFETLPSDIYSLDLTGKAAYRFNPHFKPIPNDPPQMQVNFMGIAGFPGPLPYVYAEMILQRERSGDTSLRDFLDIFNHRLISILHRIRKQYIVGISPLPPDKTHYAMPFRAILGILPKPARRQIALPDKALYPYMALFWQRPRSAHGLERILSAYLQVPIRVEQCIGISRPIEEEDQTIIGIKKSQWNVLGEGAVIGTKTWDYKSKIRIHVGPLTAAQFDSFLPMAQNYKALLEIARLYLNSNMVFDINLSIIEDQIEPTTLSDKAALGWNTWLKSKDTASISVKAITVIDNQVCIDPAHVESLVSDSSLRDSTYLAG